MDLASLKKTLECVDQSLFQCSDTNYDGVDTDSRVDRRRRTWLPDVSIEKTDANSSLQPSLNRGGLLNSDR